jgi:hypothetical protein
MRSSLDRIMSEKKHFVNLIPKGLRITAKVKVKGFDSFTQLMAFQVAQEAWV